MERNLESFRLTVDNAIRALHTAGKLTKTSLGRVLDRSFEGMNEDDTELVTLKNSIERKWDNVLKPREAVKIEKPEGFSYDKTIDISDLVDDDEIEENNNAILGRSEEPSSDEEPDDKGSKKGDEKPSGKDKVKDKKKEKEQPKKGKEQPKPKEKAPVKGSAPPQALPGTGKWSPPTDPAEVRFGKVWDALSGKWHWPKKEDQPPKNGQKIAAPSPKPAAVARPVLPDAAAPRSQVIMPEDTPSLGSSGFHELRNVNNPSLSRVDETMDMVRSAISAGYAAGKGESIYDSLIQEMIAYKNDSNYDAIALRAYAHAFTGAIVRLSEREVFISFKNSLL